MSSLRVSTKVESATLKPVGGNTRCLIKAGPASLLEWFDATQRTEGDEPPRKRARLSREVDRVEGQPDNYIPISRITLTLDCRELNRSDVEGNLAPFQDGLDVSLVQVDDLSLIHI